MYHGPAGTKCEYEVHNYPLPSGIIDEWMYNPARGRKDECSRGLPRELVQ